MNRKTIPEAIAALDHAIDGLYEYSNFRQVSYEVFRQSVESKVATEQEELIRKLGMIKT